MSFKKKNSRLCIKRGILSRAVFTHTEELLSDPELLGYYLTFAVGSLGKKHAIAMFWDFSKKILRVLKLKLSSAADLPTVIGSVHEKFVSDSRISHYLLAHNHINDPMIPSPEDISTTNTADSPRSLDKEAFLGHYIISDFDYVRLTGDGTQSKRQYKSKERPGITNDKKAYSDRHGDL